MWITDLKDRFESYLPVNNFTNSATLPDPINKPQTSEEAGKHLYTIYKIKKLDITSMVEE